MNKERNWSCAWCKYLKKDAEWPGRVCVLYPQWMVIDNPDHHYCGQHDWSVEALREIRKEMKDDFIGGY
jgi:hypothetical protein